MPPARAALLQCSIFPWSNGDGLPHLSSQSQPHWADCTCKGVTMTNDKTKELPTGFIITVYRAGRSLVRLVKAAVVQWRASPSETRTGSLPS